jgi:YhcH/YjgK/YiaL family protein
MALYGSIETVKMQAPKFDGMATALAYVDDLMRPGSAALTRVRGIAVGDTVKTELTGAVFVIEQALETRLRADAFFESHRKFIDVQVVVEGEELMEIADVSRMTVKQPYNEKRDLIIYEDSTEASLLRVYPGQVAVFVPSDVHMPTLRVRATAVQVRKCVVKVPVV